jgi:hypothetical protein
MMAAESNPDAARLWRGFPHPTGFLVLQPTIKILMWVHDELKRTIKAWSFEGSLFA